MIRRSQGGFYAEPWDRDGPLETLADLEPDEVLAQYCQHIPGPRVLDLGMGDGEHALWLASLGYEVEGVDVHRPAVAAADFRAMRLKLTFQTYLGDILDFDITPDAYDLILCTAVLHFLRPSQLVSLAQRIRAGLRPGGLVYVTVLTTDDPGYKLLKRMKIREVEPGAFDLTDGDPPHLLYYFRPRELLNLFPDVEIVHYAEERYLRPDTDQGFNAAAVLLGRRPARPLPNE